MQSFYSYNPTKIIFGRGAIEKLSTELAPFNRIFVLYGRSSIFQNGAYEQIQITLKEKDIIYFGGVNPNPEYEFCLEALEAARDYKADFILAVGGGSVIDAAKFLALAYYNPSPNPWELLEKNNSTPTKILPFGCIQTAPGSGSEYNNGFVLSHRSLKLKRAHGRYGLHPKVSILDPELTFTLPWIQTARGIVDAYVHVLEQYLTVPREAPLQDRQAEAILKTLIETAPILRQNPYDYTSRATVMWCAAQALNGHLSRGVPVDFSTHLIAHELTALYDIPHADTLAIVWGGVMRFQFSFKYNVLAQYASRVFGDTGNTPETAERAIEHTEQFFSSLGLPIRLRSIGIDPKEAAVAVADRLKSQGLIPLSDLKNILEGDVYQIILNQGE